MGNKILWEILVPTHDNNHQKIAVEHHQLWDQFVEKITRGLTIDNPTRGIWVSNDGVKYEEKMIPVKIAADLDQIAMIADFTAIHYHQKAVMYYKVSDEVYIINYNSNYKKRVNK